MAHSNKENRRKRDLSETAFALQKGDVKYTVAEKSI